MYTIYYTLKKIDWLTAVMLCCSMLICTPLILIWITLWDKGKLGFWQTIALCVVSGWIWYFVAGGVIYRTLTS